MGLFSRKLELPRDGRSWGELRPRPLRDHEERGEEGGRPLVSLLVPRFRSRLLAPLAARLRPYRVHLDAVGSFVWLRLDGNTRVDAIGAELAEAFGDEVAPVEERVPQFLHQLAQSRLIALEGEGDADESA